MRMVSTDRVHAPYINGLAKTRDWAGLVRYWIALRRVKALRKAIEIVNERAARGGERWQALAGFLAEVRKKPLQAKVLPPDKILRQFGRKERATVFLLTVHPYACACEIPSRAGAESDAELLESCTV